MNTPPFKLFCPKHFYPLQINDSGDNYIASCGCSFPIIHDIPRFTSSDNYSASFGLQWNTFCKTQLDSYTGTTISRDRLTRLAGGSLEIFKHKEILEVGCGAGRFTEIMLDAGAHVFASDISNAVEANHQNCQQYQNYFICQADILKLPVVPEQFDIVICIGVIQHTPQPEATMNVLCSYLKPKGLLIMDHYTYGYAITPSRQFLRTFLLGRSNTFSMRFCKLLSFVLWPIHKILWNMKNIRGMNKLRSTFLYHSPIVDYHDAYPQLGALLYEWAILDTYDTLTDYYKHLRSAKEIENHLQHCGMEKIEIVYAGNGVEARAKKAKN